MFDFKYVDLFHVALRVVFIHAASDYCVGGGSVRSIGDHDDDRLQSISFLVENVRKSTTVSSEKPLGRKDRNLCAWS